MTNQPTCVIPSGARDLLLNKAHLQFVSDAVNTTAAGVTAAYNALPDARKNQLLRFLDSL